MGVGKDAFEYVYGASSIHRLVGALEFFPGWGQFRLNPAVNSAILSLDPGDASIDPLTDGDRFRSVYLCIVVRIGLRQQLCIVVPRESFDSADYDCSDRPIFPLHSLVDACHALDTRYREFRKYSEMRLIGAMRSVSSHSEGRVYALKCPRALGW
ncbi:hypothetical protein EGT31_01030 [Bordetella bronchiseptica]|nr:hypothetical protein EGT31_01030 [Bordetella bronchiseptica]RSC05897.1 hypothetical protein EGT23_03880 [Bordetella bronchiseptica]